MRSETLRIEKSSANSSLADPDVAFTLLIENVKDYGIFLTDPSGQIVRWNAGAAQILGYEEAEVLGRPCDLIFTPEDNAKGEPERERGQATQEGRSVDERWHIRKDRSRFWASGIMTALYSREGELHGYAKILRDFTQQKQTQEALLHHQAEIEALNRRLCRAITETHHRVKNSLQVVGAMVDMLSLRSGGSVPLPDVQRVGQHIQTMASIQDLLTQRVKTNAETSDISAKVLLERLTPLLERTTGGRPLTVKIGEANVPMETSTSLCILINELVSNAIKHGDGTIDLSLQADGGVAELTICDHGAGFPDGFNRETAANTGLELVDGITRFDLRGEAFFENTSEGGACVIVRFPLSY